METQTQELCQRIQAILCPEYFEQCTRESFKNEIEQCIQATILLSSSTLSRRRTSKEDEFTTTCTSGGGSSVNVIAHYNRQIFNAVLFYPNQYHSGKVNVIIGSNNNPGIQWGPLCKSHDSLKRSNAYSSAKANITGGDSTRQESLHHNSALEILLQILLNSSLVPLCFASTMIQGLFEVCVQVYSSLSVTSSSSMGGISIRPDQYRPSSLKILQCAIQSLLQRCPCAIVSKSIGSYLYRQVMDNLSVKVPMEESNVEHILMDALETYSIERSLTALTVASDLVSMKKIRTPQGNEISIQYSISRSVVHQSILSVLKEIDAMDIYLLESQGRRRESSSRYTLCETCHSTIYSTSKKEQSKKRIKTSSLSYLHGEASDDDDNFAMDHGRSKYCHNDRQGKAEFTMHSWKKIIKEKNISSHNQTGPEVCDICSRRNGYNNSSFGKISALPLRMVEFRGILYKMFIDLQISSMLQMNTDRLHHSMMNIFCMALKYPMSASCRLCAILAADSAGVEEGYMKYTKFLLNAIKQHNCQCDMGRSRAIDGVHIYRELLKECAVFDDPHVCWRSLVPLMDTALILNEHHEHSSRNVEELNDEVETNQVVVELLISIGVILSSRVSLIQNIIKCKEYHLAFNEYVVRLSEAFGETIFWIDGRMSSLEQSQVITCLQTLGILSFFDEDRVNENSEEIQKRQGFWLHNAMYSVRLAHVRMGPKVSPSNKFFSEIAFQDESSLIKKRKYRSREDSICEEPLMDYINDDLLRIIFSFLHYRVLVRATYVCKSWHSVGNENSFWQSIYERQFKPIFLESLLSDETTLTIKQAFEAKHSKRNDFNWKQLFIRTKDRDESLGFKVSCGGWRHRYCRVFGCNVVLRKKDDEKRHMKVHEKDVFKKVAVIERAEARRLLKEEKAKTRGKAKTTAATSSSTQTAKERNFPLM